MSKSYFASLWLLIQPQQCWRSQNTALTPARLFNNSQASLLHISCHGLLQKKQEGTRGPCSSGGHAAPEVIPCHLKLPLNFPCWPWLLTNSTQVPQLPMALQYLTPVCLWCMQVKDVPEYYALVQMSLWGYSAIYLVSCRWVWFYPEISAQPKC